jgi:hypothetical protein
MFQNFNQQPRQMMNYRNKQRTRLSVAIAMTIIASNAVCFAADPTPIDDMKARLRVLPRTDANVQRDIDAVKAFREKLKEPEATSETLPKYATSTEEAKVPKPDADATTPPALGESTSAIELAPEPTPVSQASAMVIEGGIPADCGMIIYEEPISSSVTYRLESDVRPVSSAQASFNAKTTSDVRPATDEWSTDEVFRRLNKISEGAVVFSESSTEDNPDYQLDAQAKGTQYQPATQAKGELNSDGFQPVRFSSPTEWKLLKPVTSSTRETLTSLPVTTYYQDVEPAAMPSEASNVQPAQFSVPSPGSSSTAGTEFSQPSLSPTFNAPLNSPVESNILPNAPSSGTLTTPSYQPSAINPMPMNDTIPMTGSLNTTPYDSMPSYPRSPRVVSGEPFVTEGPCQFDASYMVSPASYSSDPCQTYSPIPMRPGYAAPQGVTSTVPGYYAPSTIMPGQYPGLYSNNNSGYRELITFPWQENVNVNLGRGIFGQPVAYVPGQGVRNFLRYIFP